MMASVSIVGNSAIAWSPFAVQVQQA